MKWRLAVALLLLTGHATATFAQQRVVLPPDCSVGNSCGARAALAWNDSNPVPTFPPILRSAMVEGEVALRFLVSPAGVVDSSSITVLTSTNRAFVPPTVRAVSKWRLATLRGQSRTSPTRLSIKVQYRVSGDCRGLDRSTRSAWGSVGSTSTLTVTTCSPTLVSRDQVQRNRAAAGMPPLDPPPAPPAMQRPDRGEIDR